MAKNDPKDTDWMKYFCFIFGALIVVVGVIYFKYRSERQTYETDTLLADKLITGKGMRLRDSNEVPTTVPGLAVEVHQYVSAYRKAVGGSEGGIPMTEMKNAATNANMRLITSSQIRTDEVRSKNYQTISRDFTYDSCTLEQLVTLMFNIESKGRLRVFEVRWQLEDDKLNADPPHHKIRKPVIKVGIREPLASNRS